MSNFTPLLRRQPVGAHPAAFLAAQFAERDCRWVPFILFAILDLFSRDVANEFR
jgi:hypothetical protein